MAWKPISSAPRDGSLIRARGNNFGDPDRGKHIVEAQWGKVGFTGSGWVSEDGTETFHYLTEWDPRV